MGCDMVVALDRSTAPRRTLFGQNTGRPAQERQRIQRTAARTFTLGERVFTGLIELSQSRSTYTVLANQATGMWGYHHGVNEMHVAVGCTHLHTRLGNGAAGLRATDLVRLALERSSCARQAVDLITDLLARHGQAAGNGAPGTNGAFLIADGREAFALETSGRYWVLQEVREVRAMSDCCTIHQDWNRIAPGLAGQAIERQWWPEDGTKLDFAGAFTTPGADVAAPMRRWARASYLLQEQNGHIDLPFLRRLLGDHYETADLAGRPKPTDTIPICQHGSPATGTRTAASMVAELYAAADAPALAWCGFGPPCLAVFFPVFLAGALPEPFGDGSLDLLAGSLWPRPETAPGLEDKTLADAASRLSDDGLTATREQLQRLQEQLDQQAVDFQNEASELRRQGQFPELQRQATLFHQHALESFEKAMDELVGDRHLAPHAVAAW